MKPEYLTWYCNHGHNVLDSDQYDLDDPPECATCGSPMSVDSTRYDEVHQRIEEAGIASFEKKWLSRSNDT